MSKETFCRRKRDLLDRVARRIKAQNQGDRGRTFGQIGTRYHLGAYLRQFSREAEQLQFLVTKSLFFVFRCSFLSLSPFVHRTCKPTYSALVNKPTQ